MEDKNSESLRLAVDAKEASRLLGIGRSTLYKLLSEKRFPKPVNLGVCNPRWLISDLEAFMKNGGEIHGK